MRPRKPATRRPAPFRIVFLGTSDAAVAPLAALLDAGHEVVAVYTKPDRKAGRGRRLRASPVKTAALAHGLTLEQPAAWDDTAREALAVRRPDLAVVVAYGLILPAAVLGVPRLGCVNLHASLLPRWRGAAPVARAIEAGDEVTGVSLMRLAPALDTGPVIARRDCRIEAHDTAATLGDKLARLGEQMLGEFLEDAERLLAVAVAQDEDGVCYAHKLSKTEAAIDWRRPAAEIERKVRALNPWPIAQTRLGELTLRIWESEVCAAAGEPGRIVADGGRLVVRCGQDALAIKQLQPAGGRVMRAQEFLNGHGIGDGVLGE